MKSSLDLKVVCTLPISKFTSVDTIDIFNSAFNNGTRYHVYSTVHSFTAAVFRYLKIRKELNVTVGYQNREAFLITFSTLAMNKIGRSEKAVSSMQIHTCTAAKMGL